MTTYKTAPTGVLPDVRKVADEVTEAARQAGFDIQILWGYASFPDHSNRRCIDFMINSAGIPASKRVAAGNWIADYVWTNRKRLGLNWEIWNRHIRRYQNTSRQPIGVWAKYTGPKPHTDHVHIEVEPGYVYRPPAPVTPTYQLLNLNCQWPGFSSTPKSPSWSSRCKALASIALKTDASIIIAQELGKDEAAGFAQKLGPRWLYQRTVLNTILWRDDWRIEDPTTQNESRDYLLQSFGQLQRTAIAVRLVNNQTGQYVWVAGTHLAAAASDLSDDEAVVARRAQAGEIAEIFGTFQQIVLGADFNDSHLDSGPRKVLRDAGWTFDVEQVKVSGDDAKHGIDGVATKSRVTLKSVAIVPLGSSSDHDSRLATFTITNPPK